MNYSVTAESVAGSDAFLDIKKSNIVFGATEASAERLPNPAELFLGAFAACILKNVERFSTLLKFKYDKASVKITANRIEHPPRMEDIQYELNIFSNDRRLRTELLKKNIEKFGTIYNTVKAACEVSGKIIKIENYV